MKIILTALACALLAGCATFPDDDYVVDAAPLNVVPVSKPVTAPLGVGHALLGGWSPGANAALGDPRTYMDAPAPNLQRLSSGYGY